MPGQRTTSGLRANRNWLRLWLGQAVSITGDYIFYVTVTLWIATVIARGQPWAPAAVGGALIAVAIPALAVGPLAGVYVDRWNRRTMMTADAARALLIAALIALPLAGRHLPADVQIGIIYAVLAAASCFTQFFSPSRMAIIGVIVDPADLPRASGLLQATASFAAIIGPPIAAPLLFVVGVQWALIANAASFAVSFLMLRGMRVTEPGKADRAAQASFLEEFRAGVRFFRGSPVLITLTIGVVIATLGTGALNALMVFFLPYNLHVEAKWLGALLASLGLGSIAGALLTGQVTKRMPRHGSSGSGSS
jgi:MFS family permease